MPRQKIVLACSECRNRNYTLSKDRRKHPERMEVRKHCPYCNRHTVHREAK